jgi:hypothetical protein
MAWSLAACDRDAVLGDLQEEFDAIAAARSIGAARRWYWMQTLRSVGPNLARRIRQELVERGIEEAAWQRASRRTMRTIGYGIVAGGAALWTLAWFTARYPISTASSSYRRRPSRSPDS